MHLRQQSRQQRIEVLRNLNSPSDLSRCSQCSLKNRKQRAHLLLHAKSFTLTNVCSDFHLLQCLSDILFTVITAIVMINKSKFGTYFYFIYSHARKKMSFWIGSDCNKSSFQFRIWRISCWKNEHSKDVWRYLYVLSLILSITVSLSLTPMIYRFRKVTRHIVQRYCIRLFEAESERRRNRRVCK